MSVIGQVMPEGDTGKMPDKPTKTAVSGPSGTRDDLKRKRETMTGRQVRELCRSGAFDAPTAGVARGYVQANLVVLEASVAGSFETFCRLNRGACPLIEVTGKGQYEPRATAPGADLRTDLPRYRVYRDGALVDRTTCVTSHWTDDCVAFLIGCSFTFEAALQQAGLPVRHIEQSRNVPMYRTDRPCLPSGIFHGPLVVSMRPMTREQAARAQAVTSRFAEAHGSPVHIGDPSVLGISDLCRPDYGDAVTIHEDEVPVFWACGVTPIEAIMRAKPPLAITHEPGHMFVTDTVSANQPMP